jgi:hypothetical protein
MGCCACFVLYISHFNNSLLTHSERPVTAWLLQPCNLKTYRQVREVALARGTCILYRIHNLWSLTQLLSPLTGGSETATQFRFAWCWGQNHCTTTVLPHWLLQNKTYDISHKMIHQSPKSTFLTSSVFYNFINKLTKHSQFTSNYVAVTTLLCTAATWARMPYLALSAQQCRGLAFLHSPCFPCPCFSAGLCAQRIFAKCDLGYKLVRTVQEVVKVYLKTLSQQLHERGWGKSNHQSDALEHILVTLHAVVFHTTPLTCLSQPLMNTKNKCFSQKSTTPPKT